MYARIGRYRFHITDQRRYDAARSAFEASGTSDTVAMLIGMDGCRGARELQDDTAEGPGLVLVTLWETREHAESVAERARDWLGQHVHDIGVRPSGPPEAEVHRVMGGRST